MKHFLIIALAIASILPASAQLKNYSLKVGDFKELTVAANINVIYRHNPDSTGYALYTCDPEAAHALTFVRKGDKLKIEVNSDDQIDYSAQIPIVVIYSSELTKIQNLNDSTVHVISPAPVQSLTAKVIGHGHMIVSDVHVSTLSAGVETGRGTLDVSGRAKEAKLTIASAGTIDAMQLESDKTKCWMVGSGNIYCVPGAEFTVYGAGSGTIHYKGEPKKIKKHALGVKMQQIEE